MDRSTVRGDSAPHRGPWLLGILMLALLPAGACAGPGTPPTGQGTGSAGTAADAALGDASLGPGFVVWESNRTGDWRLFLRHLDGSGLRRISPEEPELQHCCPHIAPDGRSVVYLARPAGKRAYPEREVPGELRLLTLGADGEVEAARVLVSRARTYGWGDRAVVWRSAEELVYVGADGRSLLLDLPTGRSTPLTTTPRDELGWLVNAPLTHATHAAPTFSPYDRERRRVLERRRLGGCEPYFSHDGRWGFFMPAAGGPIQKIDLGTREVDTVLPREDPLLGERGYLYFPMLSRDGRRLAFGASPGEHDHFRADYDIFVAATDPETLELVGEPVRLTAHPGTDRYPDVFAEPLALGRHVGEAPLTVRFRPEAPSGKARWSYGDGTVEEAAQGEHTYREPGSFRVEARWQGSLYRGEVEVEPARPPRVRATRLEGAGRRVVVHFDEPVRLEEPRVRFVSGAAVESFRLGADGRSLEVVPGMRIERTERLELSGIVDRAKPPHTMPPTTVVVEPPTWPASREGLVFVWQSAASANLVHDPSLGSDRATTLTPRGRARLSAHHTMDVEGGFFEASPDGVTALLEALRRSHELTLTLTATPRRATTDELESLVNLAPARGRPSLVVGQEGRFLVVRMRTGGLGPDSRQPPVRLFAVEPGEPVHATLTYVPGRLRAYRDGELVVDSDAVAGNLARWDGGKLRFGAGQDGGPGWAGLLEGIAVYDRALAAGTIREDALRHARLRAARPAVKRSVVTARLTARSEVPTLREISPYREALAVDEYAVLDVLRGEDPGETIRVARWVILDGETLPGAGDRPGQVHRLVLSPFAANPQLESVYLAETLPADWDLPLYYAERSRRLEEGR